MLEFETQNSLFGSNGSAWDGRGDAWKFPNPFMDIASMYIPTNINDAMYWCEFLLLSMPPFMSVINRVVSYFLTDIEVTEVSDDVRDKYEAIFDNQLHMIQRLQDIGKDYFCFSGETPVVTREGLRKIKDLAGKKVEVLNLEGKWRKAKFKSYGVQKTREIRFGTRTSVWATDEHLWAVNIGDKGEYLSWKQTDELRKWYRVPIIQVPRPEKNDDYLRGTMHGIVLCLSSRKDNSLDDFIEKYRKEHNLSISSDMHELPKEGLSVSYWYGVFSGVAAVAGYFQPKAGYFFICNNNRETLESLKKGFEFVGIKSKTIVKRKIWNGVERFYIPFSCNLLTEEDFIRPSQIDKIHSILDTTKNPYLYTCIRSIGDETREEEVFCCEEPKSHTFTLGNGIVTGNCYGNSFVSVYLPFDRYLQCPTCGNQVHISKIHYEFDASSGNFLCECPKCKQGKVVFTRIDRRIRDTSKVNIIRWNPKRIKLKVHPISGEIRYYYKLDQRFVDHVRRGDPFYINTTQWGFIETCLGDKSKSNAEYLFEFEQGQIYHLRDTVFSGLQDKIRGWAIPPILPYFKLAYYIQLMRRYDEAIALDFIMPFRILFPQGQAPQGQDALTMVSMQSFISAMSSMVEKKRKNMTSIEVSPFAIGYQLIGGEAKQLAPKDSIQYASNELLNALGIPQELFSGTLSLQAAPIALRLFEREWTPFVDGMNTILQWISDQISRYFGWDRATVKLTPITLADDMDKKGLQMQAAAGQDISKQTAYRTMGIDYMKEQERIIQEQQDIQKLQEKAMANAQAQQANGALGGGGDGGGDPSGMNGPGGQVGATPGDIFEQAKQIAQQLIQENNQTHTRQMLASIKQTNPTLWAMVKGQLQEQRQQLASQGQQMMIQQMSQGG